LFVPGVFYLTEPATEENTLFAFDPTERIVPTTTAPCLQYHLAGGREQPFPNPTVGSGCL